MDPAFGNNRPDIYNHTIMPSQPIVLNLPEEAKSFRHPSQSMGLSGLSVPISESPVQFPFPHLAVHHIPSLMPPVGMLHPTIIHMGHAGPLPMSAPLVHTSFPNVNMSPFHGGVYVASPPLPQPLNCHSNFVPMYPLDAPMVHGVESHCAQLSRELAPESHGSSAASSKRSSESTIFDQTPALDKEESASSSTIEPALTTPPAHDNLSGPVVSQMFSKSSRPKKPAHNFITPQDTESLSLQMTSDSTNRRSWQKAALNKDLRLPASPPLRDSFPCNVKNDTFEHVASANKGTSLTPIEIPQSKFSISNAETKMRPPNMLVPNKISKFPDILSPASQDHSDLPPELFVARMMGPQQPSSDSISPRSLQEIDNRNPPGPSQELYTPFKLDADVPEYGWNPTQEKLNSKIKRTRSRSSRGTSCKRSWLDQNKIYQDKLHARGFRVLEGTNGTKVCSVCHQHFAKEMFVWRHALQHIAQKPFHCNVCGQRFTRSDTLQRHMRRSGHFTEGPE